MSKEKLKVKSTKVVSQILKGGTSLKKLNKPINFKIRYNIITVLTYCIGIILLVQLFNLQIVHGNEYLETSNTRLTRESVLKAARGNIRDNSRNNTCGNYNEQQLRDI